MEIIVSSYYKYVNIDNPEFFQKKHQVFCNKLGIKGKILVSKEGINGSISGTLDQISKYENYIHKNILFKDVMFKRNITDEHPFKKTIVRTRDEIVTSRFNVNSKKRGLYISPKKLKHALDNNEEIILLDARNNYESKIGKFKNAITPDIETFRDFKKIIPSIKKYKNKQIVMYCTGGVRCEKASALLIKNGFNNVMQIEGGILNYIEQFPDTYFEGRCFVFDNRLSISTGDKTKDISICELCHIPSGRYINCGNIKCDKLFICCESCDKISKHTCSKRCKIIGNN